MTGLADAACRGRAEELRLGVERAKLDLGRYHGQQEEEDGEADHAGWWRISEEAKAGASEGCFARTTASGGS